MNNDRNLLHDYELIVLGGGLAGLTAALEAAAQGFKTALVERGSLGGSYVNTTAIPGQIFHKAATSLWDLTYLQDKGIHVSGVTVDIAELQNHIARQSDKIAAYYEELLEDACVDVYYGLGRAFRDHTLQVEDFEGNAHILGYERLIVATGSVPQMPKIYQTLKGVLTAEDVLSMERIPREAVIIGSGKEACEIATILSSFGTGTTLICNGSKLLPGADGECEVLIHNGLVDKGVNILYETVVESVYKDSAGNYHIEMVKDDDLLAISSGEMILALGRRANTAGLEGLNLAMDGPWLEVDETLGTSLENVLAVGDVTGRSESTVAARLMATTAVANLSAEDKEVLDFTGLPICVATIPEMASVGLTEEAARMELDEVSVGRYALTGNFKALSEGCGEGCIKIVSEPTYGELLGVHVVGCGAQELISTAQAVMALEGTVDTLAELAYHTPSVGEGFPTAIDNMKNENEGS